MREPVRPKLQPEHAGKLLEVEDLHVHFLTSRGVVRAVEGLSFSVVRGEIVAIVGESGSGKSVSALSIMRLLPRHTGRIPQGRIIFDGRNLLDLDEEQMREIRGRDISMIFQEPMTSLNPLLTIGLQITEPLTVHLDMNEEQARARAIELLQLVGIPDAEGRLNQYPHQFSGGMRQRVMIAIGLACNPKLIIADEPTTALDVTIQAQILELMKNLSRTLNIALVIITHNLGVVARYADRVIVMYAARLVEQGSAEAVFHRPRHPYSMGLLRSVPHAEPESGNRNSADGGYAHQIVDPGVAKKRGHGAQWNGNQHRKDRRHDRDLQGEFKPKQDLFHDRPFGPHRIAEIQRCDAHHPVLELNDEGLVEAEPLALHFDCFLRDGSAVPPQLHLDDIAGNYAQHEKDEDRYAEQRGDRQQHAVDRVAEHVAMLSFRVSTSFL